MKRNAECDEFRRHARIGRGNGFRAAASQPYCRKTDAFRGPRKRLAWPESWRCCAMTLPSAFHMCPVCGKEQGMEDSTDYYLYDAD